MEQADMTVFQAENVSKTFETASGTLQALEGVNIQVAKGELISLLGPSGCGKSTLLNIISGLMEATGGTASFEGQPLTGPTRKIGMMFQKPVLFPWRTVKQNVMLPIEVFGLSRSEYAPRALQILDSVGLDAFADSYPNELSGGMQQRAALSRVLIFEPDALLLDEPFGALDEFTRESMNLELLRLWREGNYTVVLVTHAIAEAVFLSTRVAVMSARPGRIVKIVDVDLPQPRTLDVMRSERYSELCFEIRELLGMDH
jgi:NitT/TauT family transport system ATP-binding protein